MNNAWTRARNLALLLGAGRHDRPALTYDVLSPNNLLGERGMYLNLGYWPGARTFDDAGAALARRLGQAARLDEAAALLDVGFGFGDQDLLWASAVPGLRIDGINVSPLQVEIARRRVAEAGLQARVGLQQGSATALPFADGQFDRVTALESAFHFDTRERFFHEAYRVLRPGGWLALTDLVPRDAHGGGAAAALMWAVTRRFFQVPAANDYGWSTYRDKLRAAGFSDLEGSSIGAQVFAPGAAFMRRRLDDPDLRRRMNPTVRWLWKGAVAVPAVFDGFDYLVVSARKR